MPALDTCPICTRMHLPSRDKKIPGVKDAGVDVSAMLLTAAKPSRGEVTP